MTTNNSNLHVRFLLWFFLLSLHLLFLLGDPRLVLECVVWGPHKREGLPRQRLYLRSSISFFLSPTHVSISPPFAFMITMTLRITQHSEPCSCPFFPNAPRSCLMSAVNCLLLWFQWSQRGRWWVCLGGLSWVIWNLCFHDALCLTLHNVYGGTHSVPELRIWEEKVILSIDILQQPPLLYVGTSIVMTMEKRDRQSLGELHVDSFYERGLKHLEHYPS